MKDIVNLDRYNKANFKTIIKYYVEDIRNSVDKNRKLYCFKEIVTFKQYSI